MTLTVWRHGQVFCKVPSTEISLDQTEVVGLENEEHRGKAPFSSRRTQGAWHHHDSAVGVDLDHPAKVLSVWFPHCTFFSLPFSILCSLDPIFFFKVCFPFLNHCLSPPGQLGQCGGQRVLVTWCENKVETCSLAVFEISGIKLLGAPVSSHLSNYPRKTSVS